MALNALQVSMDSSDWLQGTIHDETGMDSSSPSGGDILTCSRPLIERRLRPQHDQALKCPRCDSTHTKFCYYNNYSLSQPRYFCKSCRRYWTKGGTLRNIPVGGGCRKNKKVSSKKSNDHHSNVIIAPSSASVAASSSNNATDLQLCFPQDQQQILHFSHLTSLLGSHGANNAMDHHPGFLVESPTPIDFMESKYEALVGGSSGNGLLGGMMVGGEYGHHEMTSHHGIVAPNFNGLCSTFGVSLDHGNSGSLIDPCQRLMMPYDHTLDQDQNHVIDVKPNPKLLSLEWHDQGGCSESGKESFGYLNGLGSSWPGLMNCYRSSETNPLV